MSSVAAQQCAGCRQAGWRRSQRTRAVLQPSTPACRALAQETPWLPHCRHCQRLAGPHRDRGSRWPHHGHRWGRETWVGRCWETGSMPLQPPCRQFPASKRSLPLSPHVACRKEGAKCVARRLLVSLPRPAVPRPASSQCGHHWPSMTGAPCHHPLVPCRRQVDHLSADGAGRSGQGCRGCGPAPRPALLNQHAQADRLRQAWLLMAATLRSGLR